jgi:hypothetical protein
MSPDSNDSVQQIKDLRVSIDACINQVESLEGSRALSLVKTKLEEAKMWAGKRFEELGRELPKEYQDKA